MKPIQLAPLSPQQINDLSQLYRTTRDVRLRTRAQIVLLAAEQRMSAPDIAAVVRESDQTVCNWIKRYEAEGIEGLKDAPRPGSPSKVTPAFAAQLVEAVRRPSPTQSGTALLPVDPGPAGGLYGGTDGHSGNRRDGAPLPGRG